MIWVTLYLCFVGITLLYIANQNSEIKEGIRKIMITEAQFKTDLATVLSTFKSLVDAVNTHIANTPAEDWTDTDTAIQTAASDAQKALAALNPPAAVAPPVVDAPPTS